MEKFDFDQSDFSYVKRRGRIYVHTSKSEMQFGYLRKKFTRINSETKQWEHGSSYKVQINTAKEIDAEDWSHVLMHFEQWLSHLPKQNP